MPIGKIGRMTTKGSDLLTAAVIKSSLARFIQKLSTGMVSLCRYYLSSETATSFIFCTLPHGSIPSITEQKKNKEIAFTFLLL